MSHNNGKLTAPARNNYFYGKMLDVDHFQMEQRYFNRKRWLVNQLGMGAGVLCGLDLVVSDDGSKVWIRPGVAIDPHGHEIIVPDGYCIENPRQPTDSWGNPDGHPIDGSGLVTICLGYHECEADPVPVLVGDCDVQDDCRPSTVRERFRVWIKAGEPADPAGLTDAQCAAIFPRPEPPDPFNRRSASCLALDGSCPEPASDCVVLGIVTLPEDDGTLVAEQCRGRISLYSNAMLFDMLLCLADRVDRCCQVRQLRYTSGDGQVADAGTDLSEPLIVEVVDGSGDPVANHPVNWRVRAGGGTLGGATAVTDANGRAASQWRLGAEPGHNKAEVYLDNGSSVTFDATGTVADDPEPAKPPVVTESWLPNATLLSPRDLGGRRLLESWKQQPRIELTFDQKMDEAQLDGMNAWLRVWQLQDKGEIVLRALNLKRIDPAQGRSDFTAAYALEKVDPDQPARYLVQIQSKGGTIRSAGSSAQQLDADFAGTKLSVAVRRKIWKLEEQQTFGDRKIWDGLIDSEKRLPSGDETEGGDYHSWFGIEGTGGRSRPPRDR